MPTFDVEIRGRAFEVDAPSAHEAVAAAQKMSTLPPTSSTEEQRAGAHARVQSEQDTLGYLGDTLRNIPGDVVQQGKGMVQGIGALLSGDVDITAIPGAVAEHYAGYLDGNERARRVRDEPLGTVLDLTGVASLGKAAVRRAPAVVAAAKPAVQAAARAAGTPVGKMAIGAAIGGATAGPWGVAAGAGLTGKDALFKFLEKVGSGNAAAEKSLAKGMSASGGAAAAAKVDSVAIARQEIARAAGAVDDVVPAAAGRTLSADARGVRGAILPHLSNSELATAERAIKAQRKGIPYGPERDVLDEKYRSVTAAISQRSQVGFKRSVK